MAKELPYFKFEPMEWVTGNIQMCSDSTKGKFIDLCCYYWARLGDISEKMAKIRCGEEAFNELIETGIIKSTSDVITIKFLDAQLTSFTEKSQSASDNAKSRWDDTPERIKGEQLYVIRCWGHGEEFVKIGITNTSINRRYSGKMPYSYEAIIVELCENSTEIERLYCEVANAKSCEYSPKIDFHGKLECYKTESLPHLRAFAKSRNANYLRSNAIREEKSREEERRKDNINLKEVDFSEIKPFIDVVISKKGLLPEHGAAVWNEFFQREKDTEFENISHVRRLLGKFINGNDFSHLKKTGNGSAITTDGNYRCLELDDGYYWVWHERNGQPDYKQKRKATEDDFKRAQTVS